MERIQVVFTDLPPRIHALTVYNYDEGQVFYTILINACLSTVMQCEAYDHEIKHIDNNDFELMLPLEQLELLRHEAI